MKLLSDLPEYLVQLPNKPQGQLSCVAHQKDKSTQRAHRGDWFLKLRQPGGRRPQPCGLIPVSCKISHRLQSPFADHPLRRVVDDTKHTAHRSGLIANWAIGVVEIELF